jgi:hypothetical protein
MDASCAATRSALRARKAFAAPGELAPATATAIIEIQAGHIDLLLSVLFGTGD